MAKMKNFMMDVEEFCDGYFYGDFRGAKFDFTAEEIADLVDLSLAEVNQSLKNLKKNKIGKMTLTNK